MLLLQERQQVKAGPASPVAIQALLLTNQAQHGHLCTHVLLACFGCMAVFSDLASYCIWSGSPFNLSHGRREKTKTFKEGPWRPTASSSMEVLLLGCLASSKARIQGEILVSV